MAYSAGPLLELLAPHLRKRAQDDAEADRILADPVSHNYVSRLASLPLGALLTTEPSALRSSAHTLNVSVQSLSSRSHKALIASSRHLSTLPGSVTSIQHSLTSLLSRSNPPPTGSIAALDSSVHDFTVAFQKDTSAAIAARNKAHLLSRNLDRVLDILELPALLASSISAGNYPNSLDILSHVRRLVTLYPNSPTILSISRDCEAHQRAMVSNLISTLTGSLKLPLAMKTVGYLKRAVPEMSECEDVSRGIFLVCRLAWVENLFQALDPLRELADEERSQRLRRERRKIKRSARGDSTPTTSTAGEQHTERYLKRWIEIFREQSFAVISMYRSIFPSIPTPQKPKTQQSGEEDEDDEFDTGAPPPPLATFTLHLLSLLENTLTTYLPNIQDRGARESLLTQVLYAAGSLGRLGGDFSKIVASLGVVDDGGDDNNELDDEEWVEVMRKHRLLASRLEQLAAGSGGGGGAR
ncbi:Dor1-like family-domain-containing protein [Peziza echinospora]|nr:Dor1-like family-domain-containing protein [Peziza echinospora]